jgi:hypothetical protein
MKYAAIALSLMLAQTVAPATPTLSTADKVAIQTFEVAKQKAQNDYADAQQGENAVMQEWAAEHKGWHLNPSNFTPVADTPEVKK